MSAEPGATIHLSAIADDGYAFGEWIVRSSVDSTTLIPVRNDSFVMPEEDVVVSATFLPAHHIDIATVTNGTINANLRYALQGAIVSLSAQPDTNYVFDRWYVYNTDNIDTAITVTDNSFTMPDFDVTIATIFRYSQTHNDTADNVTEQQSYTLPINGLFFNSISQQILTPDNTHSPIFAPPVITTPSLASPCGGMVLFQL